MALEALSLVLQAIEQVEAGVRVVEVHVDQQGIERRLPQRELLQRFVVARRASHAVPQPLGHQHHPTAHAVLVFDHQDGQRASGRVEPSLSVFVGRAQAGGQLDRHAGAAALDVLDPHAAAHRFDQTVRDRQAEAGPLVALGREERIEHSIENVRRNAGAGIIDGEQDVVVGGPR